MSGHLRAPPAWSVGGWSWVRKLLKGALSPRIGHYDILSWTCHSSQRTRQGGRQSRPHSCVSGRGEAQRHERRRARRGGSRTCGGRGGRRGPARTPLGWRTGHATHGRHAATTEPGGDFQRRGAEQAVSAGEANASRDPRRGPTAAGYLGRSRRPILGHAWASRSRGGGIQGPGLRRPGVACRCDSNGRASGKDVLLLLTRVCSGIRARGAAVARGVAVVHESPKGDNQPCVTPFLEEVGERAGHFLDPRACGARARRCPP